MKHRILIVLLAVFAAPVALADTLLVERVQHEATVAQPARGATMDQVLAQFGEPGQRVGPVGGDRPQHPPITRWVYTDFSVYFENDRVIDSVLNRATAYEQGPRDVD